MYEGKRDRKGVRGKGKKEKGEIYMAISRRWLCGVRCAIYVALFFVLIVSLPSRIHFTSSYSVIL